VLLFWYTDELQSSLALVVKLEQVQERYFSYRKTNINVYIYDNGV